MASLNYLLRAAWPNERPLVAQLSTNWFMLPEDEALIIEAQTPGPFLAVAVWRTQIYEESTAAFADIGVIDRQHANLLLCEIVAEITRRAKKIGCEEIHILSSLKGDEVPLRRRVKVASVSRIL